MRAMLSSTVRRLGIMLLVIGIVTTAWSVYAGLISFYLVIIVPVLTSDSALGSLPLLAIFSGIVLWALGPALGEDGPGEARTQEQSSPNIGTDQGRMRTGGVVLIGPIPILFGSDNRIALVAAAMAILVLALLVLLL